MSAASRADRLSSAVTPPGALTDAQALAALFRITAPQERARAVHFCVLAALIACGAAFRFIGLGAVGLHGDEETMALAVRGILEGGAPYLPSGMLYPRGLTQLYLMAASVSLFGETSWALRLPSALCGVTLIPLAWLVGRRFLRPNWNLAFAAAIAFIPEVLIYSQTARMYVFMLACIAASMACLFAWERSGRSRWLVGAVAALIVGLDMHELTIAVAPLLLLPGLLRGDLRRMAAGSVALLVTTVAYIGVERWVGAQYPSLGAEFAATFGPEQPIGSTVRRDFASMFDLALWGAGVVLALLALNVARAVRGWAAAMASGVLLLAGLALQLALYYHLAALAYLAGAVLALRRGASPVGNRLVVLIAGLAALAAAHAMLLAPLAGTFIRTVGAMVGQPSVWPYVRVIQLSPAAGVAMLAAVAWGLWLFTRRRPLPDYWLLAVMGVWAPIFALGAFAWNVPSRYTSMSLIPMLLCAFAFAQQIIDALLERLHAQRAAIAAVAAALTALLVVNPVRAAAVWNAGYGFHPDHAGAADFMRSQGIVDEDIVLAEDVLQQTYYLGGVDYWLIGPDVARRFTMRRGGQVVDFYTGTPVIATPAMLDDLLQNNPQRRIFVIGSAEDRRDHRLSVRGPDLHEAIESDRFETIFVARDGRTRVMRATQRRAPPSILMRIESQQDAEELARGAASEATSGREPEPHRAHTPAPQE